ncbi:MULTISPECIES: response regulator [Streptomyces]|uniref:Response regulator n=1 Tax=Streptomyces hirsutus TaxID=35620 RepID=A0ABZ1GLF8_9ACTN|nr:response regulator [Streptomyces hirsutus]WSD06137.1 response regulator [Streptomyces hirsutus]WTD20433.1 response regulator [Streptomyces hirsutus]WTD74644.1 response regulator [Streptomyces sp. NBC_01635]
MPGKDFVSRITPQETASLTDAAVGDLAQRLARRLLGAPSHPPPDDPAPALALLHVLDHLKQATERLQQEAAAAAARAGAGYPQIGAACGMTRQGARRRWPGLFHHSTEKPTEHPTMTTPARPFDVLLVEDDIADAMLIEEALSERGARNLVQVTDGVAALEHLRTPGTPRPDLIVLDLNMPRMNGRDLLKVLKNDDDLQTIPVVVLTTSTAPDDVTGAYSSHANAYVTKPVNLEEFEQAVQSIDSFYLDTATRPRL